MIGLLCTLIILYPPSNIICSLFFTNLIHYTFYVKTLKLKLHNLHMPDLASNFAIAITSMTTLCIVLVVIPIALML